MITCTQHLDRRTFATGFAMAAIAAPGLSYGALPMTHFQNESAQQKVRFQSEDSFIVGSLFTPPDYRIDRKWPAVVLGGSLTAVKEQMGGVYAAELAKRGYIALSIDYRNYGESGGELRQYEDPEAKAVDWASSISWLMARRDVSVDQIGGVGVCTSGGTVLYAAARDNRLGAVACVASHFAEPAITASIYKGAEAVEDRRRSARRARDAYLRSGINPLIPAYSDVDLSAAHPGPNEYYMDKRRGGGVLEWRNAFAVMGWEPWLDFDPVSHAARVRAPTLIVHSDGCALPQQARKVHDLLAGPKALHWTTGYHFDFYDGPQHVAEAVEAIDRHFRRYLS